MPTPVREITGIDPAALPDELLQSTEPVVVRGLVRHWPAVQAALASGAAVSQLLRRCWRDATVNAWIGAPEIEGRFFYDAQFSGFNFHAERLPLGSVLDALARHHADPRPPSLYVGSTTIDTCLPGFRDDNDLGFGKLQPLMSLWLGNRTRIAAHQDLPANLACVVAGRRRFTLFEPGEVGNLYIGPLDFTPAGQPVSLVDITAPDLDRFPRYADAARRARGAELAPGDAILIPSLWWHHVEATTPFNALVNYWWRDTPEHMDAPVAALLHTILCVRELPPEQRRAWQQLFEHYVFAADASTAAHIPEHARGVLKPLDAEASRRLRAQLLQKLNR
ncbi:cupin-like domain-containing protein [Aquincola sp. S2]|uniref:Cupin-like domain-containing protein n=2 Tax=Pseudaquabacterium terrae TaxID=2732868 RepID=A0ABX2EB46_9BURK|nr:cupin-like domain-containing protein [Aquabacterium terrae]